MNLSFNFELAQNYKSHSQMARVLTENWVEENVYCPHCGCKEIKHFPNNTPVADFYCPECNSQYELKSSVKDYRHIVNDGAYDTMIKRITSKDNPDFLLLNYNDTGVNNVRNLMFIPKYFFVPEIVQKRKPLSDNSRRAGWVGCNIMLDAIPKQGRISIVENGKIIDKDLIMDKVSKGAFLKNTEINVRGWLMAILNCIDRIKTDVFNLSDIYRFEDMLKMQFPENNNIQAKIRQQLQILRDKGLIIFLGKGVYRKI